MTDHNISTVNDHESYCETCEEFVPKENLREHQLDDQQESEGAHFLWKVINALR